MYIYMCVCIYICICVNIYMYISCRVLGPPGATLAGVAARAHAAQGQPARLAPPPASGTRRAPLARCPARPTRASLQPAHAPSARRCACAPPCPRADAGRTCAVEIRECLRLVRV